MIKIKKIKGINGVFITDNEGEIELMVTKNEFQWIGFSINEELIDLLKKAIKEFEYVRSLKIFYEV